MGLVWSLSESVQFQQGLRSNVAVWGDGLALWETALAEIGVLVGSGPGQQLNGEAWNSAKTLFMDRVLPIVSTGLTACSWLVFHLNSYSGFVQPLIEKASYLDEDALRATIDTLNGEISALARAHSGFSRYGPDAQIGQLRAQVEQIQDVIDSLVLFNQQVTGLFNSEIALSATMSAAVVSVSHGTISASGVYVPPPGDKEAWVQGLVDYDSTHPRDPKPVFDPSGQYGGNQELLYRDWNSMPESEKKEIISFIRGYYPDLSTDDIRNVIGQMTKSGCGYIADVNSILAHFANDPAGFQGKFGFPLYKPDGTPNFNLLFTTFWCYVQFSRGIDPTGDSKKTPDGIFPTGGGYLKDFLQDHHVVVKTSSVGWATIADYDRMSRTAGTVTISGNPTILYDMNGATVPAQAVGGHAMVVTGQGTETSGRQYLVVSSWGKQYKLYPDVYGRGKKYDTDGDGQYDAIDLNGDGKPDPVEKYFTMEVITYG